MEEVEAGDELGGGGLVGDLSHEISERRFAVAAAEYFQKITAELEILRWQDGVYLDLDRGGLCVRRREGFEFGQRKKARDGPPGREGIRFTPCRGRRGLARKNRFDQGRPQEILEQRGEPRKAERGERPGATGNERGRKHLRGERGGAQMQTALAGPFNPGGKRSPLTLVISTAQGASIGRKKLTKGTKETRDAGRFVVLTVYIVSIETERAERFAEAGRGMSRATEGEIERSVRGAGRGKIAQGRVVIGGLLQNIVRDDDVVIATDEFTEGGLFEGTMFDAQVGEPAAARRLARLVGDIAVAFQQGDLDIAQVRSKGESLGEIEAEDALRNGSVMSCAARIDDPRKGRERPCAGRGAGTPLFSRRFARLLVGGGFARHGVPRREVQA